MFLTISQRISSNWVSHITFYKIANFLPEILLKNVFSHSNLYKIGYIWPIDHKNSSYESYHKCLRYYEAKVGYKWKEPLKKSQKLT